MHRYSEILRDVEGNLPVDERDLPESKPLTPAKLHRFNVEDAEFSMLNYGHILASLDTISIFFWSETCFKVTN